MFGAVKLTKSADPDEHSYSGYDPEFDFCGGFPLSDGSGFGKNVIIFIDMGLSVPIDNYQYQESIYISFD